jgi:two-component system phosphate regulon response regulator PhoB
MEKILIIEDEDALAKVLGEKFRQEKFEVRIVDDGEKALPAVRQFMPNMVLLDLILPGKSGFEILKEMKGDPELERIPVIVLSNLGEDESIKEALSLGAKDYFVKTQHPINEVVDKVKEKLLSSGA